jgi:hypothetical protein
MSLAALIICLASAALGALGVAVPDRFLDLVRKVQTPRGLVFAGLFRVIFGMVLLFAASVSKAPGLVALVGFIAILKGITLPLWGVQRLGKLLDWWAGQPSILLRGWAFLAMAISLVLAYAVLP